MWVATGSLLRMSPTESARGSVRPSAAEIDAQIRRLCDGRVIWTEEALREWRRLTAEWNEVKREGVVPAA